MSPAQGVAEDNFRSLTGKLKAPESGKYTIGIAGNGGMRLIVDGQTVIEELQIAAHEASTKRLHLRVVVPTIFALSISRTPTSTRPQN